MSATNQFDVIVIGAGINGAGIARDAAMRGLKVLLIDKSDIGSGTSSASTRPERRAPARTIPRLPVSRPSTEVTLP